MCGFVARQGAPEAAVRGHTVSVVRQYREGAAGGAGGRWSGNPAQSPAVREKSPG